jgi:hypothetical protein
MKSLALSLVITSGALASTSLAPQLYHLTTETGMPHLEENLRYSITHETRCLGGAQLATAFPVLEHAALKGCHLEEAGARDDVLAYRLSCEGSHGTTGDATWAFKERRMVGTLNVKLGGKNMTFYQRITAVPVGECVGRR